MVVQLLVFYYVLMPLMGIKIDGLNVAITVFGLNSGAYVSEIMRGGILSVDPGQLEGGRSVGMSYATTMFKIVIPQAIKNILPTLGRPLIHVVRHGAGRCDGVDCRDFDKCIGHVGGSGIAVHGLKLSYHSIHLL